MNGVYFFFMFNIRKVEIIDNFNFFLLVSTNSQLNFIIFFLLNYLTLGNIPTYKVE